MRDYEDAPPSCRTEVIPKEGKEVAILTFYCSDGCTTVWPSEGETSKNVSVYMSVRCANVCRSLYLQVHVWLLCQVSMCV